MCERVRTATTKNHMYVSARSNDRLMIAKLHDVLRCKNHWLFGCIQLQQSCTFGQERTTPLVTLGWNLAKSMKPSASDRLGDLVTEGSNLDISRVFQDIWLLGICLETLFSCTTMSYPGQLF